MVLSHIKCFSNNWCWEKVRFYPIIWILTLKSFLIENRELLLLFCYRYKIYYAIEWNIFVIICFATISHFIFVDKWNHISKKLHLLLDSFSFLEFVLIWIWAPQNEMKHKNKLYYTLLLLIYISEFAYFSTQHKYARPETDILDINVLKDKKIQWPSMYYIIVSQM